jgi:hypothetical protein
MDEQSKSILKRKYAVLPDEELGALVSMGKEEYEPEAFDLLLAEAKRRGIAEPSAEQREEKNEETKMAEPSSGQGDQLPTFVQLVVVVNDSDKRVLESILDAARFTYYLQELNIRGKEWPLGLMVEQSRFEDAIELLSQRFKPSGSLILW